MYVAFTLNYWGVGASADEAKDKARKAGGAANGRKLGWLVKRLPEGVTNVVVDDAGGLSWTPDPSDPHARALVVERPKGA